MNSCCICGYDVGENAQAILVNGTPWPICNDCAGLLDLIEAAEDASPEKDDAIATLRSNLQESGAVYDVVEAVNEIISPSGSRNIAEIEAEKEYQIQEEIRTTTQAAAGETGEISQNQVIGKLVNFLSTFAVVFLIGGILASLIAGIALINTGTAAGTGWAVLLGGILLSILSFAMIMLALGVAEAIGRIDNRMETVESLLASLVKKNKSSAGSKTTAKRTTTKKAAK